MGGPLVLHLLTAASLPELLRLQLRLSPGPAAAPPPLSSLGLQLCRSTGNPRDFREPPRRDAVPCALHLGLRDHAGEAVVVSVLAVF